MSLIRKLDYNPEKEIVICSMRSKLSRCKLFKKIFAKMYPNEYIGNINCYVTSSTHIDNDEYLYSQDIIILNNKHVNVINSLGLDAYHELSFSIIPIEMIFYIANKNGYITINNDKYVLKTLMDKHNISISDYYSMKNKAHDEQKSIKNISNNIGEEDMSF